MILWITSLLTYLVTVIIGLYIDSRRPLSNGTIRNLYILWLFCFLCFGYMTGGDWRFYEETYETGNRLYQYVTEPASMFMFAFFPDIITDFWIFLGIFNSLYLFILIKIISNITDKWLSVIALSIPSQLIVILLQNSFRFMMAMCFLNIAFALIFKYLTEAKSSKNHLFWKISILLLIAALFHNTSIFHVVTISLLLLFTPRIVHINRCAIFLLYLLVYLIFSNVSFIVTLSSSILGQIQSYLPFGDYSSYEAQNNDIAFTLGNLMYIVFLLFVLASRNEVVRRYKYGSIVYGITIIFFFLYRVVVVIPSGFRFSLYLAPMFMLYIVMMLKTNMKQLAYLYIIYTLFAFANKLWNSYDLIPYSNSIPYIVFGHKPYNERYSYNVDEYYKRTGEVFDVDVH